MRRSLVALIAALPLALGAGVAQAHGPGHWGHEGTGPSAQPVVAVAGTVVSVDPSASSFVASAFVPSGDGPGWGHHDGPGDGGPQSGPQGGPGRFGDDFAQPSGTAPASQQVTITTNGATKFRVNGQTETISGLAAGDRFVSLFSSSPGASLQTLVAAPALSVFAHTPPAQHQLYAFVGTVGAVNASADTVSVQVTNSVPAGLVGSADNPATFTLSPQTVVLGGATTNGLFGGSVSDVAVGDVVAGGLVGSTGETLSQVESSPLQVLIDFPTASGSTPTATIAKQAKAKALSQTLALFGYKTRKTHGKKQNAHKRHGRRSHPEKIK